MANEHLKLLKQFPFLHHPHSCEKTNIQTKTKASNTVNMVIYTEIVPQKACSNCLQETCYLAATYRKYNIKENSA
jgi:hypothetical protein